MKPFERSATTRIALGLLIAFANGPLFAQALNAPAASPKTYGTDQISYYRIAASEFTLLVTEGQTYSDESFVAGGQYQRFSSTSQGTFIASPHLPSGALVTYFELDSCDTDPVNDVVAYLILCDDLGNASSPAAELQSSHNAVQCGYTAADVSASGIQVDNYRNQITIEVHTVSGTDATRFAGVIIGYRLQVSPAPPLADFNDVPTTHPFFQFIEALYASGITAGCGGGNYCPDSPLTRGQMAVFLAKALGLQWP